MLGSTEKGMQKMRNEVVCSLASSLVRWRNPESLDMLCHTRSHGSRPCALRHHLLFSQS